MSSIGAVPASGAEVVDQEAPLGPGGGGQSAWLGSTQTVAQPFTAGMTGALGTVTVSLGNMNPPGNTNFSVAVYAADANFEPTGAALASASFGATDAAALGLDRTPTTVTARFSTPAMVTQGSKYAVVVSSTDGYPAYHWFVGTYPDVPYSLYKDLTSPNASSTPWSVFSPFPLTFATYVDTNPAPAQGSGSSGSSGSGSSSAFSLAFVLRPEVTESSSEIVIPEVQGGWMQLPTVAPTGRSTRTFLGWSTSPRFPADRAQEQIDRRWGAIDEVIDGERMIFIPAGGATEVNGSNRFYAVWG